MSELLGRWDVKLLLKEPDIFFIEPKISRSDAIYKAGTRAGKLFRFGKVFGGKKEVKQQLIQRRLAPFWEVRCKSYFDYDRRSEYTIRAQDQDTVKIVLEGDAQQKLEVSISDKERGKPVTIRGRERCITRRKKEEQIDAYEPTEGEGLRDKLHLPTFRAESHFKKHTAGSNLKISDLTSFYEKKEVDGTPLFRDLVDEIIEVVPPTLNANNVVGQVMKQVLFTIDPLDVHNAYIAVDLVNLYFRPLYVFRFTLVDENDQALDIKIEELDGIEGSWKTLPTDEVVLRGRVPWDRVMHFTFDLGAIVLREVGGPWVRLSTEIAQEVVDHVPGIIDEMKKQPKSSEAGDEDKFNA